MKEAESGTNVSLHRRIPASSGRPSLRANLFMNLLQSLSRELHRYDFYIYGSRAVTLGQIMTSVATAVWLKSSALTTYPH